MTPAPEHWRRWKRGQRAVGLTKRSATLGPGQAANDRRFSRARIWHVVILIASALAIAMAVWLLRSPEQNEEGVIGTASRVSAEITCPIHARRAPGGSDRDRIGPCLH